MTKREVEADPNKFYTWTVELSVSAPWVAGGFDFEDDDAVAAMLLEGRLSHCRSDEVKGRVVKAPPKAEIQYEQGYKIPDVDAMKALVKLSEAQRERLVQWAHGSALATIFNGDVRLTEKLDAALIKCGLLLIYDGQPTPLGWRVLAYLNVSRPA